MASDPQGSTKNLTDSRAEALQALVSSLAPGGASSADSLSKEDVTKLSEKLKELLGDADLPQGSVQTNERGEPLNEDGLPIIEITEPMESSSQPAASVPVNTTPIVDADTEEDASFVPMYRLPPAERARNKVQMHRILDLLEEEERVEGERTEARDRQQRRDELEQRRANAKAEIERLKSLKDMQKKMGKALLRNMADAREKEEQASVEQVKADLELEESRRARKPRKCVSWAELPKSESAGQHQQPSSSSSRIPLRPDVVERFPTRPIASPSPPPPSADADSDDESNPPEDEDDDEGHSAEPPLSDDTGGEEDEPAEEGGHDDDEFDIDAVQHQREIALAYFEQRNKIGADAARAMSAHSHEPLDDEWDQEDVPLDATLASPPPKSPQSKFKSSRLSTHTHVPSSTPSTSLGTSVLPSTSVSNALRSVLRTGKLEDEQLVGIDDSDGDDEDDARAFMDALSRGDVTNAGAATSNSDALVSALESAYGAPPPVPVPAPAPVPASARQYQQKESKFKLVRATAPPRTLAAAAAAAAKNAEGPREGAAVPMSETVLERKPQPQQPQSPLAPMATAIIDSPSFPPPVIVDSPSFPPSQSRRPTRPPTVLPASSSGRGAAEVPLAAPPISPGPGKKISRFKAQQQTES